MSGFDNEVLVAKNLNFDAASSTHHSGIINAAGKLPIGTGNTSPNPEILGGSIVSPMGTLSVGYVSPNITLDLKGAGLAVDSIGVEGASAPGVTPVTPDGTGLISIAGAQVAPGTTNNVIRTFSTALNALTIQVQRSSAQSTSSATVNGVCHFDSNQFTVDSNAFVSVNPKIQLGVANLGITLSAGVFSIASASGAALSSTNPAFVVLSSRSNPGQLVRYTVTANQTFSDSASGGSTISGNLFGLTTGVAHSAAMPFFIYAVADDSQASISFMISRYPAATISPSSSFIGKTGSAVASTQGSFFALGNPTVTSYDNNPCLCIGAFRMVKTAGDDWTVQALSNGSGFGTTDYVGADGIGEFHDESEFVVSTGQFGASSGSYFKPNGGTAPVFTTQVIGYYISKSGKIFVTSNMSNLSGAGVGAVTAQLALPYVCNDGPTSCGVGTLVNGTPTAYGLLGSATGGSNNLTFINWNAAVFSGVTNADFVAGASGNFNVSVSYQVVYT